MRNGEWGMGNGKWEMGNWKSKIVEIELNIFSGYYHIFLETFCAKYREFADEKQQTR